MQKYCMQCGNRIEARWDVMYCPICSTQQPNGGRMDPKDVVIGLALGGIIFIGLFAVILVALAFGPAALIFIPIAGWQLWKNRAEIKQFAVARLKRVREFLLSRLR